MHISQPNKKNFNRFGSNLNTARKPEIPIPFRVHFPNGKPLFPHRIALLFALPASAEDLVLIFGNRNSHTTIQMQPLRATTLCWTTYRRRRDHVPTPPSLGLCRKLPLGQQFGMHRQIREIFGQTKGCDAVAVFSLVFPAGSSPRLDIPAHRRRCTVLIRLSFFREFLHNFTPVGTMVQNGSTFCRLQLNYYMKCSVQWIYIYN